jgi:CheY-like chemotaxis protein
LLNQPISDTKHLVLLDINMPVMTGWEFLDRIQDQPVAERVKVAMVTSSVDRSDKVKAETYAQVVSFLEKPVTNDMLQTLKTHLLE